MKKFILYALLIISLTHIFAGCSEQTKKSKMNEITAAQMSESRLLFSFEKPF